MWCREAPSQDQGPSQHGKDPWPSGQCSSVLRPWVLTAQQVPPLSLSLGPVPAAACKQPSDSQHGGWVKTAFSPASPWLTLFHPGPSWASTARVLGPSPAHLQGEPLAPLRLWVQCDKPARDQKTPSNETGLSRSDKRSVDCVDCLVS